MLTAGRADGCPAILKAVVTPVIVRQDRQGEASKTALRGSRFPPKPPL